MDLAPAFTMQDADKGAAFSFEIDFQKSCFPALSPTFLYSHVGVHTRPQSIKMSFYLNQAKQSF